MEPSRVLRDSFVAGLALVAPLVITIVALRFLIGWLTTFIDPVVEGTRLARYTANNELVAQVLALIVIVVLIVVLGYLAQRSVGKRLFGWVDRGVNLVPLVRVIYSSVRQVSNALTEGSNRYERAVAVEYPREGLYTLGFVTGDSPGGVRRVAGQETYNVFLPNSPNPTAGRLVLVPADQVHEIDVSVRRAVRLLVTTGIAEREEEMARLQAESDVPGTRDDGSPESA